MRTKGGTAGNGGKSYLFVLNYRSEAQSIRLKKPLKNLLTKEEEEGERSLEKYGVRIYEIN